MHRGSTMVLSGVILALGVAILVSTLARGGGPLSFGVVLGILFCLIGAGRLYVTARSGG